MEGKTHFFFGFMIATTFTILLSLFHTHHWAYSLLLLANIGIIILYKLAGYYESQDKAVAEKKKTSKKTEEKEESIEKEENKNSVKNSHHEKFYYYNSLAWISNLIVMVLTVLTANFIDNNISRASPVYAFLGIFLGFAGSFYCDMDTMIFGIQAHRNPITHSYLVPFFVWWYAFAFISYEERFLILFPAMFCLGTASHLMLDRIPSTASFKEGLKYTFTFDASPGDIRHIPEVWESAYLLISGLLLIACFGLSIPQFYGSIIYPAWFKFLMGIIGFGTWGTILGTGWYQEAHKKSKKKVKQNK